MSMYLWTLISSHIVVSLLNIAKDAELNQTRDRLFMNSAFLYLLLSVRHDVTHIALDTRHLPFS